MTSTLLIPNMTCGSCAKGVAATLQPLGIEPQFDMARRAVTVTGDADPSAIVAALRTDGWDAQLEGPAGAPRS